MVNNKSQQETSHLMFIVDIFPGSTDSDISVGGRSCVQARQSRRKRESTASLSISSIGDISTLGNIPQDMRQSVESNGGLNG